MREAQVLTLEPVQMLDLGAPTNRGSVFPPFVSSAYNRVSNTLGDERMDEGPLHLAEIMYESGELHFRYERHMSEDGSRWIRHGLFVAYSPSGQILSEGQYVEGLEQGVWRSFHANGHIAAEGEYRDGRECGLWRFWNDDGTPEKSIAYENGVARNVG